MNVLIFARAPRRGAVRSALEPLLGADGALRVHAALLAHTVEWARELAPEALYVAYEPADAGPEVAAVIGGEETEAGDAATERSGGAQPDRAAQPAAAVQQILFPQVGDGIAGRFRHAVGRVFEERPGPVLVVWPDLANLAARHGREALEDLEAGADVVLGPVFDGGFYLIGLARPLPRLFELGEDAWRGSGALGIAMAAALQETPGELEVGILRVERALHRPADVRAALADPLLAPEMARVLGRR